MKINFESNMSTTPLQIQYVSIIHMFVYIYIYIYIVYIIFYILHMYYNIK